ncbi:MAG TPA: hypothetical protein VFP46_00970 [Candidatus Paceibacterota bacterium]|nr:hypothetical protein [Candidatus Paceibacterota bacterium]
MSLTAEQARELAGLTIEWLSSPEGQEYARSARDGLAEAQKEREEERQLSNDDMYTPFDI